MIATSSAVVPPAMFMFIVFDTVGDTVAGAAVAYVAPARPDLAIVVVIFSACVL